jgi:hypothetical protein
VIESGTHDELIDNDGLYKQLHEMQTGTRRKAREPELIAANGA